MSARTFVLFGPEVCFRLNLRDGVFPKGPKMYLAGIKLAVFGGSGEKIRLNLCGACISSPG